MYGIGYGFTGYAGIPAIGSCAADTWAFYMASNGIVQNILAATGIYTIGNLYAGGTFFINQNSSFTSNVYRQEIRFDHATQGGIALMQTNPGDTGYYLSFYNSSGVNNGSIYENSSTGVSFFGSSDIRRKTNIRDLTGSGVLIDNIQPRIFDWKTGEKDSYGFIAQELNKVYPAAVLEGGDDVDHNPWMVDSIKLIPILVAELKSLRQRVLTLEQR